MKYVNADDAVWKFSNSEFKRQMQIVADGGEFDLSKGKRIAQGCTRLDIVNDVDFANEFLNPTPEKTAAENAAYIAELAAHYRESFARNEEETGS
jgi:hypothetical protein